MPNQWLRDVRDEPPGDLADSIVYLCALIADRPRPIDRYIDPKFHELEKQKLWPKVWLMTVREERIPNVGDAEVYDINDTSCRSATS